MILSDQALAGSSVEGFAPSFGTVARRSALKMAVEDNEVKVGVIGCGRIGIIHLGAITKVPNVKPIIVSNPIIFDFTVSPRMPWMPSPTPMSMLCGSAPPPLSTRNNSMPAPKTASTSFARSPSPPTWLKPSRPSMPVTRLESS
eukprot:726212_1